MSTSEDRAVDTVIIGAGQAGLATAYHLTRRGHACIVVDANQRIGDNWRHQYDSLALFTLNRFNGLPGMAFPGDQRDCATKDELADFLETYATRFDLTVRLDTRVTHVGRHRDGFAVETTTGRIACHNVVIAVGPFGRSPAVPECATDLDASILQLHSSEYRRPGQLREGPVLVVGGGHSGCDIALEVAASHPTTLVGRDPGQVPVSWDSPMLSPVMSLVMFVHHHVRTRRTPIGRRQRPHVLAHGAEMLRVKRAHLDAAGVVRSHARVVGASGGIPLLADGSTVEAATVIWATGYRHDLAWLDLPVLDESGWPREYRGVATDVTGLFFCGLAYQYALTSMNLAGVGRDAGYITRKIIARRPASQEIAGRAA